jgi:tetratricopeptide (TPR) repeat protein
MKENSVSDTLTPRLPDINMHEQVIAYCDALEATEKDDGSSGEVFESCIRRTLTARHAVAQGLAIEGEWAQPIDAEDLKNLAEADQRLKKMAPVIVNSIGHPKLAAWREAIGAPTTAWWWWPENQIPGPSLRLKIIKVLLGLLIAIAFSFILEIVRRFLSVGTDLPTVVLQGLLALVATGTIWQGARLFIEKATIPMRKLVVVVIILVALAFVFDRLRPRVARMYNDRGVELYESNHSLSAVEKYQRAISLEPAYAQAHFNLGNAYEDVLSYDKAIVAYEAAIAADRNFYRPYNNLARLYLVYRTEPLKALALIDTALALTIDPEDDPIQVKYRMYKNRGWANLVLKNYKQAKNDLEEALELVSDGADAHCLMAQVLEAQQDSSSAARWVLCKTLADQQAGQVEVMWSGLALERIKEVTENK